MQHTKVIQTGAAMYRAMKIAGEEGVLARDLAAILDATPGADARYRAAASKLMRDAGLEVVCKRKGAESRYYLLTAKDAEQRTDYHARVMTDAISEFASVYKSVPVAARSATIYAMENAVFALARAIDVPVEKVEKMLEPLRDLIPLFTVDGEPEE